MRFRLLASLCFLSAAKLVQAQFQPNTANQLLQASGMLSIRGYGECIGNQPLAGQGTWDARRFVLFTGYKYDANTAVVTEIEVEHATEIYLEQAFFSTASGRGSIFGPDSCSFPLVLRMNTTNPPPSTVPNVLTSTK